MDSRPNQRLQAAEDYNERILNQIRLHDDDLLPLWTEGKIVEFHRILLEASSPYFRKLTKSVKQPVFLFVDIKYDDLRELSSYVCTGQFTLDNVSSVQEFREIGRKYEIYGLYERTAQVSVQTDDDEFMASLSSEIPNGTTASHTKSRSVNVYRSNQSTTEEDDVSINVNDTERVSETSRQVHASTSKGYFSRIDASFVRKTPKKSAESGEPMWKIENYHEILFRQLINSNSPRVHLLAEGQSLTILRVILEAASPCFKELLGKINEPTLVFVDVKYCDLCELVHFLNHGFVQLQNVSSKERFRKIARTFQIIVFSNEHYVVGTQTDDNLWVGSEDLDGESSISSPPSQWLGSGGAQDGLSGMRRAESSNSKNQNTNSDPLKTKTSTKVPQKRARSTSTTQKEIMNPLAKKVRLIEGSSKPTAPSQPPTAPNNQNATAGSGAMAGNKNSKAAREGEPSTSGVSGKVFTRVAESTPKDPPHPKELGVNGDSQPSNLAGLTNTQPNATPNAVPLTRKSHKNVDDLLRKLQKGTQRGRNCDNPVNNLTESTNTRLDDAANAPTVDAENPSGPFKNGGSQTNNVGLSSAPNAPALNEHEKNGIAQTSSSTNKTVEPSTTRADTTRNDSGPSQNIRGKNKNSNSPLSKMRNCFTEFADKISSTPSEKVPDQNRDDLLLNLTEPETTFTCSDTGCGRTFTSKQEYAKHKRFRAKLYCKKCKLSFKRTEDRERHQCGEKTKEIVVSLENGQLDKMTIRAISSSEDTD